MLAHVRELYNQLLADLGILNEKHVPDLYQRDRRLECIEREMEWLKQHVPAHQFKNDDEEICFFKTVLPPVLSLYIYYTEKSGMESIQLIGTKKSIQDYSDRFVKRMDDFSDQHAAFYEYCSLRKTNFDMHYFLRNSPANQEPAILFGSMMDPAFSPAYSIKLATMSAYRRLDAEISKQNVLDCSANPGYISNLKWTGTIAGLTELMYPLVKYVNHGNVNVKDIAIGFQHIFNVDLGNYSRTLQEIKRRKRGDNHFLLQLAEDFAKWIEDKENERLDR